MAKHIIWSIPVIIYAGLCIASIWTGWIFTINSDGVYTVGSLFFLQYVFCFGYCAIAMVRSGVNYLTVKPKRTVDKTLFLTMIVAFVATALQVTFTVNMMHIALTQAD